MSANKRGSGRAFSVPVRHGQPAAIPFWTWPFMYLFTFGVLALIGLRMVWLQGVQGTLWASAAQRNRVVQVLQRAPRGRVVDRYGTVLADNQVVYVEQYRDGAFLRERPVAADQAMAMIATDAGKVRRTYTRFYPYGAVLSHLVGYVVPPKTADEPVIGQLGLERNENTRLAGHDGSVLYERDARGRAVRTLEQREPQVGQDLQITLDAELSRVAFEALGNQRGVVIVTVPSTGEVLAAVSKPSFLPVTETHPSETQSTPLSASSSALVAPSIAAGLEFPHSPFLFRPTQAQYPPGSIFKVITALAGLERQVITESNTVRDEGELKVGDFTYQNWYWRQYGRVEGEVNVVRALSRSNDIFFYKLAEWVGPQGLADFARLFSLGEATGFPLSGEKPGLIPDPIWKQQRLGEKWFLGNTYHMGIGQGDVLVTPMQLQMVMSAVAERGRKCAPRLLSDTALSCEELSLQPESISVVVKGLREACAPGGTAFPFFAVPYDVMCKTGTAEFGAENEEGHRPTHGWLSVAVGDHARQEPSVSHFRADIVITVLVESDEQLLFKEGSRDAGPVAKTVADWWWTHRAKQPAPDAE